MSYIDYNILFYPSFHKVYQKKLQILQNRAIRIILKLPKRTNVDNYHVTLRIWHIDTRFRFFLLKYMYTLAYGEVDLSIDRCPLSTRSHDTIAFRLPSRCSAKFMNSFIYIGRNLWNALGPDIKSIPTLNGFSMSVRSMLTLEERALHSPWVQDSGARTKANCLLNYWLYPWYSECVLVSSLVSSALLVKSYNSTRMV